MERRFPRSLDSLDSLFDFIEKTLAAGGIGEPTLSTVSLVVEELFTNCLKYNRSDREIAVRIEREGDRVLVGLTDFDVDPFDITRVPPGPPPPPDSRGGFGLRLIRGLAEGVTYEHVNRESRIGVTFRVNP
jgi:anti-sigma regulatory factor (Ser/Thr protein kinase)